MKAIYRKAMIFLERDLFDETSSEIQKILEIEPQNKEAQKLMQDLKLKIENYKDKSKKVMKEMLQIN